MSRERDNNVDVHDEGKFHISCTTCVGGVATAIFLGATLAVPDLETKNLFLSLTFAFGGIDAFLLFMDAIRPEIEKYMTGGK